MDRPEFHRLAEHELNEAAQYYDLEDRFDLSTLMRLSEFLHKFVAGLEPRETIQWK